jgi:hypothetical protein
LGEALRSAQLEEQRSEGVSLLLGSCHHACTVNGPGTCVYQDELYNVITPSPFGADQEIGREK